MSVTSRESSQTQVIAKGANDQYVKLEFAGQTEFPSDEGYTIVVAWVSSDSFPPKLTAEALRQKVIDAAQGSTAWNQAVEAALLFLLRPPLVKVRADRHLPNSPSDTTERSTVAAPFVTDSGIVYVAFFNVPKGAVVSVEIAKDPTSAVALDYRELKIVTLLPKVNFL